MMKRAMILITALGTTLGAQTPGEPVVKQRTMSWESSVAISGAPQEATIGFIAAESAPGIAASPIKGAPYSATVENAFTQTLADGTRIQRKSSAKTSRDSEGRTRMEQSPGAIALVPVDMPATVIIQDPVAKQTIILNEKEKTATLLKMPDLDGLKMKMGMGMGTGGIRMRSAAPAGVTAGATAVTEDVVIERKLERTVEGGKTGVAFPTSDVLFTAAVPAPGVAMTQHVTVFDGRNEKSKTEALGKQTISGVACNATRTTHSIPAGQIGNDRPIDIVSETCFSDELKTVVSSRTNDPMHGETTMRLSGVDRSEPAKSLFEIPAGYTIKETPQPMMFERKILDRKPAQ
jgi:hypothetical protein